MIENSLPKKNDRKLAITNIIENLMFKILNAQVST
jgi:hypothetical protein